MLDGEEWVRDPTNPWVSEDGQGNSCFTLTEAGELYVRRGEFSPAQPGPLYRDHAATPSPEWLRDAIDLRAVGAGRGRVEGRARAADPIEGEHKNGKRYLLPCLESHAPIDLVALMLGTNDLKQHFRLSAAEIAAGAATLVDIILRSPCGPQNRAPNVLLICPPPTAQLSGFAELFDGAGEKSRALAGHYEREAALRGYAFLDAGQIIRSSERDGIHFEADAHQALGHAVARVVRELLGA